MGMVVAGADFGSNKTGYIVAERKGGELIQLERESRFTRMAEGIAQRGRICGDAVQRTLQWCEEMRKRFKKLGVERFRGVGTEALRRASNRRPVLELIEDVLGWPVEVISGEDEGRLTFRGVRMRYANGPLAVIDIGGGSTEVCLGSAPERKADEPITVRSMAVGAVVLTDRCGESWDALQRAIGAELDGFAPRGEVPGVLTVLGGTGANLAMMDLDEHDLEDSHIEGHVIERKRLEELRRRACEMSPKQRIEKLGLPPQRADIQVAGLAILEAVLDHLGIKAIRTSRYALRHGVLQSIVAKEG